VTAAPAPGHLLQQVLHAVQQIRPGHAAAQPGDTFTAMGLDSLDRLALAAAVEQATGLAISDQVLSDAAGPADLARRLLPAGRTSPMTRQRAPGPPSSLAGWLDEGAAAGDGTRLWHQAQIAAGAVAGDDCTLGKGCFIGAGSTVGDRVKIGNYASLFGARVGDEAMICPGALLLEDPAPRATTPEGRRKGPADWARRPVTIGAGATIGAAAVIAPGVTVGAHALVGLGAVVLRDVPAHGLVIGNPARQVGWVCRCAATLDAELACPACSRTYQREAGQLTEHPGPPIE
jgi:acetyltransferase-like isoleucine patch superfamily enzyme/acyl carrier protein